MDFYVFSFLHHSLRLRLLQLSVLLVVVCVLHCLVVVVQLVNQASKNTDSKCFLFSASFYCSDRKGDGRQRDVLNPHNRGNKTIKMERESKETRETAK